MSVWTHVNGNVRFEPLTVQLRNFGVEGGVWIDHEASEMLEKHRKMIENILGKCDGTKNPKLFWGSEMPIRYSVNGHDQGVKYRFDDKDNLQQLNISFIGDLRDVGKDGEDFYNKGLTLNKWIKTTIKALEEHCPIRSAVFLVECRESEPYTLSYTWDSEEQNNTWKRS